MAKVIASRSEHLVLIENRDFYLEKCPSCGRKIGNLERLLPSLNRCDYCAGRIEDPLYVVLKCSDHHSARCICESCQWMLSW